MKKSLPIIFLAPTILLLGCATDISQNGSCESKCESISNMCSEVLPYEQCKGECDACDPAIMDEINDEEDCEKIKEKMSQCALVSEEGSSDCDAACNNYNNQCLTLVPNANQQLFDQGYESCMSECAGWSGEKVQCMSTAQDCPSMTEVCGL